MPDYISSQVFKKKALDRWENEGGSIFDDRTGVSVNRLPDERANESKSAQTFKSPAADKSKAMQNN